MDEGGHGSTRSRGYRNSFQNCVNNILTSFAGGLGFIRQMHAMRQAGRRDGLNIFRRDKVVAA